jgi:hypothetical protein
MEYTVDVIKHKRGLSMNIKENFYIYIYREVLPLVDRFIATGAPRAARYIRILPMNQDVCWPVKFGMKWLQFTDHRRC